MGILPVKRRPFAGYIRDGPACIITSLLFTLSLHTTRVSSHSPPRFLSSKEKKTKITTQHSMTWHGTAQAPSQAPQDGHSDVRTDRLLAWHCTYQKQKTKSGSRSSASLIKMDGGLVLPLSLVLFLFPFSSL
jgi:hypothetical protein